MATPARDQKTDTDQQLRHLTTPQRENLMVRAAKLYHEIDHTQSEVGRELGLNRFQVARLLAEARDLGIVRIQIVARSGRRADLESRMQKRFALADCVIVGVEPGADALDAVSRAAADFVAALHPCPRLIGVSWGRTMSAVANHMPDGWADGVEVILLNGATHLRSMRNPTNNVAERFAETGNGSALLLPVPAIVGQAETRVALEADPAIAPVLARAAEAPVACFGLGNVLANSVLIESGYLDSAAMGDLRKKGAVGDILGRLIDADGKIVAKELDDRTIGLDPVSLKSKELSIGVCCGQSKHAVALAALRAKYVNVLIADEATASFALEQADVH